MRNFYYFNDDINVETVNNLLDKLSGFEDKIDLYFSTYGGEMSPMDFLVKCLNTFGERLTVTLTDTVMSAGVKILTDYTGKLKIDYGNLDCVMFHCTDRESYNFRVDVGVSNTILKKQDAQTNVKFAQRIKAKGLLTDKQLKQFNQYKDVIVYKEQIATWNLT